MLARSLPGYHHAGTMSPAETHKGESAELPAFSDASEPSQSNHSRGGNMTEPSDLR